VIGDPHGCLDEVRDLIARAGVGSDDRIIFAGDLVDRGPQRREMVEFAMEHESVLGNHEEKILREADWPLERSIPDHRKTREVLQDHHYDYFRWLPLYIRLPEHNAAVLHAGVMPDVPIEKQTPYILLHGQCIKPPDTKSYWPSKAPPDYRFWTHYWKGPERVIFGHTVLDRALVSEYAVGIDTGCVHGRSLTGVLLPEWKLISVPARECYYDRGDRSGKYPVHGDVHAFS
jgi:hypothetical protein